MFLHAARASHGSEEESGHRLGVHAAQRVQDRAQSAEPARLIPPVGRPHVLVQRALSLCVERLDVLATLQVHHFYRTRHTGLDVVHS